jgi:hypothetical protein
VLPVFKLVSAHVKRTAVNGVHQQIIRPNQKITPGKAHGLRSIAATTALVKHQVAVFGPEPVYKFSSFFSK